MLIGSCKPVRHSPLLPKQVTVLAMLLTITAGWIFPAQNTAVVDDSTSISIGQLDEAVDTQISSAKRQYCANDPASLCALL